MSEINFLNIIQVLIAIAMIGFILIQRGPGATAGSAFGGGGAGASGTVFGAKGSGSFLTKATAILATAFFIITMLIAIDSSQTYASAGDGAEQDLGVFGALDDADVEPGITPIEETVTPALNNEVPEVISAPKDVVDNAVETVEKAADEAVESAKEKAGDTAEQIEQAIESKNDSDDGNN